MIWTVSMQKLNVSMMVMIQTSQRAYNVKMTPYEHRRRINVDTTSVWCYVPAGI